VDEFLDIAESEREAEAFEDDLPPPVSRPAKKKPARKSSRISMSTVVIGGVAIAGVVTTLLVVVAAVGWFTSRQAVGKLNGAVIEIQTAANQQYEAAMQAFVASMQNGGANAAALRPRFQQMRQVRDDAIAKLDALPIGSGVKLGPEFITAAKEWIDTESQMFSVEGPGLLDTLEDASLPINQRAAKMLPALQNLQRREVLANLKLLEFQKSFMETNRVPVSQDVTARLLEMNRKRDETGGPATTGAPGLAGGPTMPNAGPGAPMSNATPTLPAGQAEGPPGTAPIGSWESLKPGMVVWRMVGNEWKRTTIVGVFGPVIEVAPVEGNYRNLPSRVPFGTLRMNPAELASSPPDRNPPAPTVGFGLPPGVGQAPGAGTRPGTAGTQEISTPRTSAGKPVQRDAALESGMRFLKKYGATWYEVEIIEVRSGGRVRIHWVGWSNSFDEECAQTDLHEIP